MGSRSISAGGNIDRSVVVTGDGNAVSLRFGASDVILPLERRQHPGPNRRRSRPDDPPRELDLLLPDADLLHFVGRQEQLDRMCAWLDDEADISVHGLIGRAGSGKTRLAIELCRRVDGDPNQPGASGWLAGFLSPADLALVIDALATRAFDWPRNALLVIDYAAAGAKPLERWLDRLAADTFKGKLRLLLLDREAPTTFGWWRDLADPSGGRVASRRHLFLTPRPESLEDLADVAHRERLFWAAAKAASRLNSGREPPASFSLGADPAVTARLAQPQFGNPLNLAMAGLCTAQRSPLEALALRRLDAARRLARRELKRFARLAQARGLAEAAIEHAVAFNTLVGGLSLDGLDAILEHELAEAHVSASVTALSELLQQELPPRIARAGLASSSAPRLDTVQPDLIGEGLVVEALLADSLSKLLAAPALARRAFDLDQGRASTALIQLTQDYGYALEDPAASKADRSAAAAVLQLLRATAELLSADDVLLLTPLVLGSVFI